MTGATPPVGPPPDQPPGAHPPGPPGVLPPPRARADQRSGPGRGVAAALATIAATIAVFYCLPIHEGSRGVALAARLVLLFVGLGLLGWLFARQVSAGRRGTPFRNATARLFAGVCLTVLLFATTYYSLAYYGDEMSGIRTRTDALYFTMTVLTTVGFGDVHAVGQAARVVVTVQMGFDVLFIASAGAALRASGAVRRGEPG
ncbi:potassium channel family protein [Frankia sp. AgKG'84/4]|uniref:potassium channel family protein n=1 Tax=Frankia sp. AgKG'84/4 TaxID=573490 RepID=UPI00200E1FD9|nr:potassium channel family protein [Frankia sp. AgKG'84/4]MCL9796499.1 potassium channel family protein [Frankia sp. AgKG'84/4]